MSKARRKPRGYSQRKVANREFWQRFLIVFEGEKTEPKYFNGFRVSSLVVDVHGLGVNPSLLVDKAKKLEKEDEYDQVWCVFDRDSFPKGDFNAAIQKAESLGFRVAYSNEAFELWYVLHFEFLNTGIPRSDYIRKLSSLLGRKYQKNSDDIYDLLIHRQDTAIQNAENLISQYNYLCPEQDNPSTTVYLLVKELNRFSR
jgi:hypothetical protein